ncbi:lambda family phage tail tape measure protein [Rhodovulum imhoffii]|uniref:Lambda family phage tail tape measure protein n=1 Tax=Rhodovulum imhoffii TaxID=365340 RepID=A0A2T5BVB3_9RHOB|nr:phage tail tape measure protein [Rhodovulum imhoffii]MBK5934236.1 phage tail protein [Rhodovulum imhoffii]PTN03517.1 lambda family phage tail tape measure protein [Rhodovulum imhoffii]
MEDMEDALAALEETLDGSRDVAAAFNAELVSMRESLTMAQGDISGLSRAIGRGLRGAFDRLVFDGARFSDTLRDLGRSIANAAYSAAMRPVQNHLGGLVAGGVEALVDAAMPFGKGGAFTQGRVIPFARGGVISQATYFPLRGAAGLMGEAGPEAIMPLARGADGRLGVRSAGGGRPVNVTVNIATPDIQGFRRSQSQIAAEIGRAMVRGQRNQ